MTRAELNTFYEIFMMIDTSLELIIRRAKQIKVNCSDPNIYHTALKSKCHHYANEILDMAKSIEDRKTPALLMIEEQRKGKDDNEG